MKTVFVALQFLTRIPVSIGKVEPADLARSMAWFPVIGLFIGVILAAIYFAATFYPLTAEINAALILLALIIITGGLHLDGLSDTADGFYAGKNKEEILRIMDDPHTGAMGVMAIGIVLLLKYALLVSLFNLVPVKAQTFLLPLLVIPMVSRWGMVVAGVFLPAARPEGLGQSFLSRLRPIHWISASIITLAAAYGLMQINGLIICSAGLVLTLLSVLYIKYRLGGLTGDTLGAINEVLEVGGLFAAYLIYRI